VLGLAFVTWQEFRDAGRAANVPTICLKLGWDLHTYQDCAFDPDQLRTMFEDFVTRVPAEALARFRALDEAHVPDAVMQHVVECYKASTPKPTEH